MESHTPKHFVLQLGSLISLYVSVVFLLVLIFGVITLSYPDAAAGIWEAESATSSIRLGIAMVLVFFPTYLVLTRTINTLRRQDTGNTYLTLTKWLIYLSLLVGGGVLLGDLVTVIMAFLEGEITIRFILKAGAVLLIVGAACYYYLLDARGYWLTHERASLMYAGAATLIVCLALGLGFQNIETPEMVREQRLDERQIMDLQTMQGQVVQHFERTNELPQTLEEAYRDVTRIPSAPDSRTPYRYERTENGFALCAQFANATPMTDAYAPSYPTFDSTSPIIGLDDWQHTAGEVCFERTIRPTSTPQTSTS
jgi:hypothetical protein